MDYKIFEDTFITPERNNNFLLGKLIGPNGWLLFVACNSGICYAKSVMKKYLLLLKKSNSDITHIPLIGTGDNPITREFSDSETCTRLTSHVAGSNAYVFQCVKENLSDNTVNENIQQLLQVIRTLKAHRARNITAVLPYLPYSRQDKPSFMKREAALARLFADQLKIAGADICLTYHPHTFSLVGFYEPEMRFVALSGLELFFNVFKEKKGMKNVAVVSTDSGGAKYTVHFAETMEISYAIANKWRKDKDKSNIIGLVGDLSNIKTVIITDDETVTGSSLLNTVKTLHEKYSIEEIYIAVSHFKIESKYLDGFIKANKEWGLKEVHITDTIPQPKSIIELDFVKIHSLACLFAAVINRLHYNMSVSDIFID